METWRMLIGGNLTNVYHTATQSLSRILVTYITIHWLSVASLTIQHIYSCHHSLTDCCVTDHPVHLQLSQFTDRLLRHWPSSISTAVAIHWPTVASLTIQFIYSCHHLLAAGVIVYKRQNDQVTGRITGISWFDSQNENNLFSSP
jgi:hypothetical protein